MNFLSVTDTDVKRLDSTNEGRWNLKHKVIRSWRHSFLVLKVAAIRGGGGLRPTSGGTWGDPDQVADVW